MRVAIVGSGFSGLGLAIRLKQEGEHDFVVFEAAHDVGGTWRDNSYPGCACDVQSHLYSFSFAPNPGWTRTFSEQKEILAYLQGCARRFDVLPHVRFGHPVQRATWDDAQRRWDIVTAHGALTADVLVSATGFLCEPSIPKLPGMAAFEGKVMHSARWDHAHDLAGREVAVVGTGASAIQFVPFVQPQVKRLTIFQRTPPWIMPRNDRAISAVTRRLFRAVPAAQLLARGLIWALREVMVLAFRRPGIMRFAQGRALRHMKRSVKDAALRRKLTPTYTLGCKRVLISDTYLGALTRPNVDVVTEGIREVRARSIVTADGVERPVDTIILGTGFQVTDLPIAHHVYGRAGARLHDVWQGSPKAHLGTTVSGFPNFFLLLGPNTGLGHTSVVVMIEAQIAHVVHALRFLKEHGLKAQGKATLEPRPEAQAAFVAHVDERMKGTVWTAGGCHSWYLDATGRNSTLWPGATFSFRRRVGRFDAREYVVHG